MTATNQSSRARCALVTGATGYVGSRLAGRLLAEGWLVHVITRQSSSLHLLDACLDRVTIHVHDGSVGRMLEILATANPDVVFHLAAKTASEHQVEDLDQLVTANVLFSAHLVEAMYRNGTKYIVNTETFWQHNNGTDTYDPVCLYAATKQAFCDILLYYVKTGHVRAISLVLYDTYGPGDPRRKLFAVLREAARRGGQVDMTLGEQIVDMTHVDDVVEAYIRAGEMLLMGNIDKLETYAVTSGHRMTLKQLVELAVCVTGVLIHPNWGGRPYRTNEVMVPWLGKPLPGWRPRIDLETGIREVFNELE
ncbi:NAD-dependent epimerase/dehydratase family protein [Thiobacillus sp.]